MLNSLSSLSYSALNREFFSDTCWTLSMYLEAVAMLPQIYMFQRQASDEGGTVEVRCIVLLLFALCAFRWDDYGVVQPRSFTVCQCCLGVWIVHRSIAGSVLSSIVTVSNFSLHSLCRVCWVTRCSRWALHACSSWSSGSEASKSWQTGTDPAYPDTSYFSPSLAIWL